MLLQELWPMEKQGFWQELCHVGVPRWSTLFLKDCSMERTHAGAVLEKLQPVGRTHAVHKQCFPGTPHAGGGECEEERAAEMKHCRLTVALNSPSPCTAQELRVKLNLGRRKGGQKVFCSLILISYRWLATH